MRKKVSVILALMLALALLTACGSNGAAGETAKTTDTETVSAGQTVTADDSSTPESAEPPSFDQDNPLAVATLAGPTGMGMIRLFEDPAYEIGLYTSPDQITAKVITGEVSAAAVPSNVAAMLYNKMGGGIKIAAVTTMGVLYVVENGDTVGSIADLAGKTIYATGQGSTPEYVLNKILAANGLDDVNVVYMGAHADLASAMAAGDEDITIALLPEPYVSTVTAANPGITVRIDINEEWKKMYGEDVGMPMGVTIVTDALAANKTGMDQLIADSSASVEYVTGDSEAAAADIAAEQIVGSQAIALSAIPRCGISFITGGECKAILGDYFEVMFESNPDSLGGAIPDDDIYYMP